MIAEMDNPPAKTRKLFRKRKGDCRRELNDRQRKFVEAYCSNGGNGVAAARAAGYSTKSYTTIGCSAHQVLNSIKVKEAIAEHYRAAHMSPDEVVARLEEQARANPSQFFTKTWKLSRKQVERNGHLIRKLKAPVFGKNPKPAEIELHDGQLALLKIGTHLGLFQEKLAVVGDQGGPVRHEFTVRVAPCQVDSTGPKQVMDAQVVAEEPKP